MPSSVVDLFCGAGGLTHGFILEGFRVIAGIDLDSACKYPFEYNNRSRFIEKDVADLSPDELLELYPSDDTKILAGCAPCRPFSKYTQGLNSRNGGEWGLLHSFADLVRDVRPEIVTMENVPQLKKHGVLEDFMAALRSLDYSVTVHDQVYCPRYGVPQTRERLVLFASILGPIELIQPTHSPESYVTVRQTIGHLPPIAAGEDSKHDPLHRSQGLSELNLKRIRASKAGGTWEDWNPDLVANCHSRDTGSTYPSVYGRMKWDRPSPTITTQCYGFGNGRFGHPNQDRAISLREAALLQTFPAKYRFVKPGDTIHFKTVGRLIGNAVPVRLSRAVAKSIKKHLEEHHV